MVPPERDANASGDPAGAVVRLSPHHLVMREHLRGLTIFLQVTTFLAYAMRSSAEPIWTHDEGASAWPT